MHANGINVLTLCLNVIKKLYFIRCIICYSSVFLRSNVVSTMGLMVRNVTVWYQSQGFDVEPRWASQVVFRPRV